MMRQVGYIAAYPKSLILHADRQAAVSQAKSFSMQSGEKVCVYQLVEVFETSPPLVLDPLPSPLRRA